MRATPPGTMARERLRDLDGLGDPELDGLGLVGFDLKDATIVCGDLRHGVV